MIASVLEMSAHFGADLSLRASSLALNLLAQTIGTLPTSSPLGPPGGGGDAAESTGMSILEQVQNGGLTGYIIIGLSIATLALVIVNLVAIRPDRLVPPDVVELLRSALNRRAIEEALAICRDPANDCFLTRVLERGLTRYQRSAFGPFELKEALEEAGGEQVARLYRATEPIGLIGAIAPMLGLLGTVIGMVGAFDTISGADARPELLAGDISKALITTLMGLILAIPTMAAFTYLRNRIDTCATLAARQIEDLTLPLEMAAGPGPGFGGAGATSPGPNAAGAATRNTPGGGGGSGARPGLHALGGTGLAPGAGIGGQSGGPGGGPAATGTQLTGAARRR